jgi:hypothetical protein
MVLLTWLFCYYIYVILNFEQRDKLSTGTACSCGWVTFWVRFLDTQTQFRTMRRLLSSLLIFTCPRSRTHFRPKELNLLIRIIHEIHHFRLLPADKCLDVGWPEVCLLRQSCEMSYLFIYLFVFLTTLSVTQAIVRRIIGWYSIINWIWYGRKRSWPILKQSPEIWVQELSKFTKNITIIGIPA